MLLESGGIQNSKANGLVHEVESNSAKMKGPKQVLREFLF
jgi:hypothetical protein